MNTQNFGYLWRKSLIRNGRPYLCGTGVAVEVVADRFVAGESIADLATDYREKPAVIEAAIRLVVFARGTNLDERRAAAKVARVLPLLP